MTIKRTVDAIGRITLPPSIRKDLNILSGDTIEITQKGRLIILQPSKSYCIICGKVTDLITVDDAAICCNCARKAAAHLWPKEKSRPCEYQSQKAANQMKSPEL